MTNLVPAFAVLALSLPHLSSAPSQAPLILEPGDSVRVILLVDLRGGQTGSVPGAKPTESDPFQGEFVIQADGAIYGAGFGRIEVKDKTVLQIQKLVRTAMTKLVKPDEVIVTLGAQREQHIFLVGNGTGTGYSKYVPGLTLRQALASAPSVASPDLTTATVFRGGQQVEVTNVDKLLRGGSDFPLQNDDVVTITPESELRVWITGSVKSPGRILLQEGATVEQALAAAGGATIGDGPDGLANRGEYQVEIHRGDGVQKISLDQAISSRERLEQGDSVSVIAPTRAEITIAGEVKSPGQYVIRDGEPILTAVSRAGGAQGEGSLEDIFIYRNGETFNINATPAGDPNKQSLFPLKAGDIVVVRRSERIFYAFGSVNRQGRILVPEGKQIRLTDALALVGGLTPSGVLRRIYVQHPVAGSKPIVTEYNLDEYLKDGKVAANPVIYPGDAILFSNARITGIALATDALSSLLLINSVVRL